MAEWFNTPYEGYQVTKKGRVRGPSGILQASRNNTGYEQVTLRVGGGGIRMAVHVLVCETFHGPRPTPRSRCVRKDGNRENNSADNLEWKTAEAEGASRGGVITSYLSGEYYELLLARVEELGTTRSAFVQDAVKAALGA